MTFNPDIHHRRSIRLKNYDYSENGYYFITICTKHSENYFGEIKNGKIVLNEYGNIIKNIWYALPKHFWNCKLDNFMIMPDHFHGIIIIDNDMKSEPRRGKVTLPLQTMPLPNNKIKCALGNIIGFFKYQTTKSINELRNTPGIPIWQRNYYERIIRDEKELYIKRNYILNNPLKWELDRGAW